MIFTSISFIVFYISLICLIVLFKNNSVRQTILLVASYVFYGWWNPAFILLIFASSLWGWYLGLLIDSTNNEKKRNLYLGISLTLSLGMLAYYKYAEFLAQNFIILFGLEWNYEFDIILPVGISFFTFQTMSYGIDLKYKRIPVCKSLNQFMLFVAFFPQLVAGPIVRSSQFLPQLESEIKITWENIIVGMQLFLGGAIQKVLFADNLSNFADPIFSQPDLYSSMTLWLALISYSAQVFCDFSGYSLMAIGVARTLGFVLPENFRMPYISKSITEFWRRWHMTLSFWLRDYLYITMGGNRNGELRTYVHLLITMLLGGLWHGANWNFVIWGALHGLGLAIHKCWANYTEKWESNLKSLTIYKALAWAMTLLFVMILWIPFRCADFTTTSIFIFKLFNNQVGISWMNPNVIVVLIIMIIWHFLYIFRAKALLGFPDIQIGKAFPQVVIGFSLLMILLFAPINSSPFIYFQF